MYIFKVFSLKYHYISTYMTIHVKLPFNLTSHTKLPFPYTKLPFILAKKN